MTDGSKKVLRRFALSIAAVALAVIALAAQAPTTVSSSANAPATSSIPTTTPNLKTQKTPLTPPPGKMRGVTNAMRWEAAKRTADRKARAQKAHPMGVKQ